MTFSPLKVAGSDAIRVLNEHRKSYPTTGLYPFLIGDAEDFERIQGASHYNKEEPSAMIRESQDLDLEEWIGERRREAEEYDLSPDDLLGDWPGEIVEKGSIGLHKDLLSGKVRSEVYLGLAKIEAPWQLPAALKYGGWNDCPYSEVHCAFHRRWQENFGAEISGMSSDIVECIVTKPPTDQESAIALAWEQYWYCADIVDQGCESIANLAATLLNSNYWYFWWD